MARRTALPLIVLAILLVGAIPARATEIVMPPAPVGSRQAASPAGPLLSAGVHVARAQDLWATVNVCDTDRSPDAMGVRASMPGNGTSQRMFMRFTAQWYSGLQAKWLDVPGGISPWVYAGSARYRARQAGWSFRFVTPPPGRAYILRGTVQYQWRSVRRLKSLRKHKHASRSRFRIARERTRLTSTGVRGVRGGDPKGTSKAMCAVANLTPAPAAP